VNEEAGGRIWCFAFDETSGLLTPFQIDHEVRLRAEQKPDSAVRSSVATAEMSLSPTAARLYVASRGANIISTYAVDAHSGALTFMAHTEVGGGPRHFQLSPCGKWMLVGNLSEDRISVFKMVDGVPLAPAHSATSAVSPAHLLFVLPPCSGEDTTQAAARL
jgi:hypothetical protein